MKTSSGRHATRKWLKLVAMMFVASFLVRLAAASDPKSNAYSIFTSFVDKSALPADIRNQLSKVEKGYSAVESAVVEFRGGLLGKDLISITLTDGTSVVAKRTAAIQSATGESWDGLVQGIGAHTSHAVGLASFSVKATQVFGQINSNGQLYIVEPLGLKYHAVVRIDPSKMRPDHDAPSSEEGTIPERRSTGTADSLRTDCVAKSSSQGQGRRRTTASRDCVPRSSTVGAANDAGAQLARDCVPHSSSAAVDKTMKGPGLFKDCVSKGIAASQEPPQDALLPIPGRSPTVPSSTCEKSPSTTKARIRVGVAISAAAHDSFDAGTLAPFLDQLLRDANNAFSFSQVHATLELAGWKRFDFVETSVSDDFERIVDTTGDLFGLMDSWRDKEEVSADIVVVIEAPPGGACGQTRIKASSSEAFAVVDRYCAMGKRSFAHEIGHLLGGDHNPESTAGNPFYPYGHGFQKDHWVTVMATDVTGHNYSRSPIWSNPDVKTFGFAFGTEDRNNNACVFNENASNVASFR